ncbi:MAG: YbaB/EbfC family nucleoid-associated protein [Actinobacteria bacterium]|nr:YbaB/EbfC family nucleoid-associated protein [Actinomycetota bacterium]
MDTSNTDGANTGGANTGRALTGARAALELADRARDAVAALAGRGRSPDGAVRARVGGDGLLEAVRFGPDALRQDPETLAAQVCAAVRAAQQSLTRQAGDAHATLLAGPAGLVIDPARLAGQVATVQAELVARMAEIDRCLADARRRCGG